METGSKNYSWFSQRVERSIFEDIRWSDKFWAHMCDEDFYNMHLENVIGMKTIIAKVKYTFKEDQDWIISKKNTEINLVYQYNWIDRCSIPEWNTITSAPLEIGKIKKPRLRKAKKNTQSWQNACLGF